MGGNVGQRQAASCVGTNVVQAEFLGKPGRVDRYPCRWCGPPEYQRVAVVVCLPGWSAWNLPVCTCAPGTRMVAVDAGPG